MVLVDARDGQAASPTTACRASLALLVGLRGARGRRDQRLAGDAVKLPPFIVTLGTLSIFTALTLHLREGPDDLARHRTFLTWTGNDDRLGDRSHLTTGVILMLLLYVVFAYVLRQTAWGRHLYADGRRRRGGAAGRHPDQPRAAVSVYIVAGVGLRHRRLDPDRADRGADPNAASTPTWRASPLS